MERIGRGGANWMVNRRLSELETAQAWHIPPHVWDTLPEDSRAEMMAVLIVKSDMQRYEEHVNEQKRANQPRR